MHTPRIGEMIDCVFGNTFWERFFGYQPCAFPHQLIRKVDGPGTHNSFLPHPATFHERRLIELRPDSGGMCADTEGLTVSQAVLGVYTKLKVQSDIIVSCSDCVKIVEFGRVDVSQDLNLFLALHWIALYEILGINSKMRKPNTATHVN